MKQEKQQTLNEDQGTAYVVKSSPEDGWHWNSDLPRGWMSKVKQHKFRKTGVQGKQEFRKTGGPLMWKSPVRMMAGKRAATGSENG